jgi:ribose transport system substrate-binding protein
VERSGIRHRLTSPLLLVAAILVVGCSSSATPSPTAAPPATQAPTVAAPTTAASETAAATAAVSTTAWKPDSTCASTDPAVTAAIANTTARTGPQSKWYGPTTGPKPAAGTKIVWIPTDAKNALSLSWAQDGQAVSAKLGWTYTMIDGQGTAQGWTQAFTQAIALNPAIIVTSADGPTLKNQIADAAGKGIKVIGIHATALPGPDATVPGLYTNITTDPRDIATAMAEYIIADSCGTAKAIVEYDSAYQIATVKGETMKAVFQKCTTCTLLDYVNSPLAQLSTLQPQLCANWATKYGKGWYAMTIYDGVWDYCVPSLKSAGLAPGDVKLVASDGTLQGYQRIQAGDFQVATVPEPAEMEAYIAINEAIRAVGGLQPDYGTGAGQWTQPVFIHFKDGIHGDNLATEGGDKNQFFPTNDYINKYLTLWGVQ